MLVKPAILEQDFEMIKAKVMSAKENGLQEVQIDIADGLYVANKTFGDIDALGKLNILFEAHLMVVDCMRKVHQCKKQDNVTRAIVHFDALTKNEMTEIIRKKEEIAIAINPDTQIESTYELISYGLVGHLLFMGVTPGFSGQEFHPDVVEKIKKFKKQVKKGITCAVDGGVNAATARLVRDYVDWVNASSFIWNNDGTMNRINLNYLKSL